MAKQRKQSQSKSRRTISKTRTATRARIKPGQTIAKTRKLHSQDGKPFEVFKIRKRFHKSLSIKKGKSAKESISRHFEKRLKKEFTAQFNKHKKRGNKVILRVSMTHNLKGKRLKHGVSISRVKIRTKKQLAKRLDQLKTQLLDKMSTYLRRKDYRSISIKGIDIEFVTKDIKDETQPETVIKSVRKKTKK